MRKANAATAAHPEPLVPDDWDDPVLVIGAWTYAGTGWRTADAALALAAADAARSRRPARTRAAAA